MRAAPFDYVAPATLDAVLELLSGTDNDARILAGGQTMIPMLVRRSVTPKLLVDLRNIAALQLVRQDAHSHRLGAMTTLTRLLAADGLSHHIPGLNRIIQSVGTIAIRNRSTVGGSAVVSIPWGQVVTFLAAWHATASISSPDGQRQAAVQTLAAHRLRPDEVLTEIRIPRARGDSAGFAIVGRGERVCAVIRSTDDGPTTLAVGGLTRQVLVIDDVESTPDAHVAGILAHVESPDPYLADLARAAIARAHVDLWERR